MYVLQRSLVLTAHGPRLAASAPKAAANSRSRRISDSSGMRLIRTEKKAYVSGLLDSELWEITRDASQRVRATEDFREGPRAFVEKRPPRWVGC